MTCHYLIKFIDEMACLCETKRIHSSRSNNSFIKGSFPSTFWKFLSRVLSTRNSTGVQPKVSLWKPSRGSYLAAPDEYCNEVFSRILSNSCWRRDLKRSNVSLWFEKRSVPENSHSTNSSILINDFAILHKLLRSLRFRNFWFHLQGSAFVATERPSLTNLGKRI